jgi:hypothetical protein
MGGCGSKNFTLPRDPKDAPTIDPTDPRQNDSGTPRRSSDCGSAIAPDIEQGNAEAAKRPGRGSSMKSMLMKEIRISADDGPKNFDQKLLSVRSLANGVVWSKLRNAVKAIHGYSFLADLPKLQNSF